MPMKRAILPLLLLVAVVFPAAAFDLDWFSLRLGGGLLLNLDDSGFPASAFTSVGGQFSFSFSKDLALAFEPAIDVTGFFYEWVAGRAVPTELEHREAFVVALVIDLPLVWRFTIAEDLGLSAGVGLVANFALGFKSDPYADQASIDAINAWLFDWRRVFAAEANLRVDLALAPGSVLGVGLRWILPALGALDPDSPSFFDRSWFDLVFSIRFPTR